MQQFCFLIHLFSCQQRNSNVEFRFNLFNNTQKTKTFTCGFASFEHLLGKWFLAKSKNKTKKRQRKKKKHCENR